MQGLLITLGAFALILLLSRVKVPLAAAILAASVFIGAMFGWLVPGAPADAASVGGLAATVGLGLIQPGTIALAIMTACLLSLSGAMKVGGQMERIVALARPLGPRVTLATLPATVGLLPMPGGAVFSAPMVESAAGQTAAGRRLSGGKLSAVNYWFRHVWEYWWLLYPGVLAAHEMTGRSFLEFTPTQLPLTAFMIGAGLLLFRAGRKGAEPHEHTTPPPPPTSPGAQHSESPRPWQTVARIAEAVAPIVLILSVAIPGMVLLRRLPTGTMPARLQSVVARYAPITAGVLAALAWVVVTGHVSAAALRKILTSRRVIEMTTLVMSVMVFHYMLDHVSAAQRIAREMSDLHVPVMLVVMILPFVAGLVTGLAIGFVGSSFPIVLPLAAATVPAGADAFGLMSAYIALAYAFGHLGQMMSPLHVCHVMSNRYFRTGFGPVYRELVPAAVLTAALAVGYFAMLWAIFA